MTELLPYALLAGAALTASTMAAVAGTGGGVLLLPVMALLFGPREAIPMYAVAQLIGNLSRAGLNRAAVRLEVVRWFALGAVPTAILGAWAFAHSPDTLLTRLLGGFLLLSVAGQRYLRSRVPGGFAAWWFTPIGAIFAFISALTGSAGPFLAPFFLAFGLFKGSYIGTEALGTAIMHVVKLTAYQHAGVLPGTALTVGLALGPIMMLGALFGKRIIDPLRPEHFAVLIEGILVLFGLLFLVRG